MEQISPSQEIRNKILSLDWDFANKNTSKLTHNIHPYPAKFIPQLAENFIKILSRPDDLVWDPFCGSGTTGLESILAGRNSVNTDINPISKIIGTAKTTKINSEIDEKLNNLIEYLQEINLESIPKNKFDNSVPEIPNLEHWFSNNVVVELALIRFEIEKIRNKVTRNIALAAFSKIITSVSYQSEETRYSSKKKIVVSGTTINTFIKNLRHMIKKLYELELKLGNNIAVFEIHDNRKNLPNTRSLKIKEESVDLIITSPPYPNAYDYFLYNRFRLFWLGYDPRLMGKNEIGSHLRHQKEKTGFPEYITEMENCFENILLEVVLK